MKMQGLAGVIIFWSISGVIIDERSLSMSLGECSLTIRQGGTNKSVGVEKGTSLEKGTIQARPFAEIRYTKIHISERQRHTIVYIRLHVMDVLGP